MLERGQIWYCSVCGTEVKVVEGGKNVAPLTCCGVDMILKR